MTSTKVYLVQHGEAESKALNPQRPLSEQGMSDVRRVTRVLKQAGIKVNRIIHSGKLRAQQTAEIFANELAPGLQLETSDLIKPDDDPSAFEMQSNNFNTDTLVVGHLPFMAKLVSALVSGKNDQTAVAYQPGSIVCLELTGNGNWHINWMLRPDILG